MGRIIIMNRISGTVLLLLLLFSNSAAENTPDFVLNWGRCGADPGEFDEPYDLAFAENGNIYVADKNNNRIQVFSSDTTFLFSWFTNQPAGIDIDPQGQVYVTNATGNTVSRYTASGLLISSWGGYGTDPGQFILPWSIAVSNQFYIYVGDNYNDRIQVFDTCGVCMNLWGERGIGPGQFYGPRGIAIGEGNSVYIADKNNNRIQKFNSSGGYILDWEVINPSGLFVGSDGNVYVTTYTGEYCLKKFTCSGSFLSEWGEEGADDGDLDSPEDVAIGPGGGIYVADRLNHRIQKYEYTEDYNIGSLYFYNYCRFLNKLKLLASLESGGGGMPYRVRICADGSPRATRIVYRSDDGGCINENLDFRIKEDPTESNKAVYGTFTDKDYECDVLTCYYKHPRIVNTSDPCDIFHLQLINEAEGDSIIREYPLYIYRAPVVMLHGLWSTRDVFEDLDMTLTSGMKWPEVLTTRFNYRTCQGLGTSGTNALQAVRLAVFKARNSNYSTGKVNLVSHSMGGNVSRVFIQDMDMYCDDICRLITLNSPHSGSQMVNLLTDHPSSLGKMLELTGRDPSCKSVDDLRVDSDFTRNYLNGIYLNNSKVPSHTIVTHTNIQNYTDWMKCIYDFLIISFYAWSIDEILSDVFNDELNDFIVSISSQEGGCGSSTIFDNQHHGSTENAGIISSVVSLLDEDPYNPAFFSRSGFEPPTLTYDFGLFLRKSNSSSGEITITGPSTGTDVMAGSSMSISVNGTGDTKRIHLTAGNRAVPVYSDIKNSSSTTFNYDIPVDALGKVVVSAAGYGDEGFVDVDSIFINVVTNSTLDSMTIFPEKIYLMETETSFISTKGHYDDGVSRVFNYHPDVIYEIQDTLIAKSIDSGIIEGLAPGITNVIACFQGDSALAEIEVIDYHLPTGINEDGSYDWDNKSNRPSMFKLMQSYPNPFNAITTIEYYIFSSGTVKLTVYDVMGRKVKTIIEHRNQTEGYYNVIWDGKNEKGIKVDSGIYFYRLKVDDEEEARKFILLR